MASFWTQAKEDDLWALIEKDGMGQWADKAKALGHHSLEATKQKGYTLTVSRSPSAPKTTITEAPPPRVPVEERWQQAEDQTGKDVERHRRERHLAITVKDTRPVAVAVISDQHIRSSGPIQLARMRADAELIAQTDGLFAMLGGDGVDNHIKHLSAMVAGGTSVKGDWFLYDHYMGMFGNKLLAIISGNHDDFTRDIAGIDMVGILANKHKLVYCPDEVVLVLTVNGIDYRIKVRHQYRYGSSFNLTHTVKRLWEMGDDDFDIGVIGHHHEAAIEPFQKHGRIIWAARPGSYQLTSSYTRRYGFRHANPTCPTFILFPDKHEVMGFMDVHQAAAFLRWTRATWPEGYREAA